MVSAVLSTKVPFVLWEEHKWRLKVVIFQYKGVRTHLECVQFKASYFMKTDKTAVHQRNHIL